MEKCICLFPTQPSSHVISHYKLMYLSCYGPAEHVIFKAMPSAIGSIGHGILAPRQSFVHICEVDDFVLPRLGV
jgi:hypothetical protein